MKLLFQIRFYLLGAALIAAFFLWPSFRSALQVDNSLTAWFIEGDPALEAYYRFQEHFGNDEVVLLLYEPEGELLSEAALGKIRAASQALEALPDVAQVFSAGTFTLPGNNVFSTTGRPLIPRENIDPRRIEEKIEEIPFLREQYFSPNLEAARFILKLENRPDFELRRGEILTSVKATAAEHLERDRSYWGGIGIIYQALNKLSAQDFGRFLGVGYLLMFLLIFIIYRRWPYVFYALSVIALSTYFTLAFYGLAGYRLNLMTTLVPAIIILLCVMDVMHILNEQNRIPARVAPKLRALLSLKRVWLPCLFTSLTTMAGFLTLLVSPIKILFNFGLFSALGILLGLLFSYLIGVIILPGVRFRDRQTGIARALVRWQHAVLLRRKNWLAITLVVLVFSLWGMSKIVIDTQSISYLPESHPVREDNRQINRLLGPYMPLEYLVLPAEGVDLQSPELIQALLQLEQRLGELDSIGGVNGPQSFIRGALQMRYGDDWRKRLESRSLIENLWLKAEQYAPGLARNFATADYEIGRFNISGYLISAGELAETMREVKQRAEVELKGLAELEATGYQSLYARIVNYVTQSQVNSFLLAVVLIFILLYVFLRDLKLAALALLPNFFPIALMLGFMGWAGIYLDTATACIASIVLSFSIDDTMHFSFHYQKNRRAGFTSAQALKLTVSHVGRAILLTSLVLFTGYFLMIFGSLKTVIYFGLLTSLSIAGALFSQLVLFPIILRWAYDGGE